MDVKQIGIFLGQLRKEKGFTQEQLGEKLGVTNKTVSRWENGNYLPPVEVLQLMSELYDISINEILCAQRLEERDYKKKAEENIQSVLRSSSFTLHEKMEYYKKKWRREHIGELLMAILVVAAFYIVCFIRENDMQMLALLMCPIIVIVQNNRMMTYVEDHVYDGTGGQ